MCNHRFHKGPGPISWKTVNDIDFLFKITLIPTMNTYVVKITPPPYHYIGLRRESKIAIFYSFGMLK